jgi:hypothetical protein
MTAPPSPSAAPGEGIRRGDLDALQSVAMLLGIARQCGETSRMTRGQASSR